MGEARPADVLAPGFPRMDAEPHHGCGTHLDGGEATLRVPLGKVSIPNGVEGPRDIHGNQEAGAFGQLFGIDIAAVFARGNGAESFLSDRPARRYGIFRVWHAHAPSTGHEVGLPLCPGY